MKPAACVVILILMPPRTSSGSACAPASTNQVLTSWLLTTSPRSSASSSRFWVGSSERSVSSLFVGHVLLTNRGERRSTSSTEPRKIAIIAPSTTEDQEAEQDRKRQADEKHLHLRHQPRQDAETEIEQQAEYQKRRRELNADPERGGDRAGCQRRDVAEERDFTGLKQLVAVVERGDDEVVEIRREDQRDAEHGRKLPTITPC